ncbi:MAG: hypothetical protein ABI151_13670 [Chitinophagaceae bacterium]
MQAPSNQDEPGKKLPPGYMKADLQDSPDDVEKLKEEAVAVEIPDVTDIPGQEHVHPPSMSAIGDTTAASDDEEGINIFEDEDDLDEVAPDDESDSDVTATEKGILQSAEDDVDTQDDRQLKEAYLDETDEEGDPINEGSMATDVSGGDLDTANAEDDDADEEIGEEDEENNTYSTGGDNKDDSPQDEF